MSHSKPLAPANPTMLLAEVIRTERVTPNMIRVTVGGESLAQFEPMGFDQWFRLFIPKDDAADFSRLPKRIDIVGYYAQYLRLPKATRPVMRNYTVREFRPEALELDIDFVAHGDAGVASGWAERGVIGDQVAILDQGIGYNPAPGVDWQLFAADESGLPAVAGILRDLPRDTIGHAFLELESLDDMQPTGAPDGVELHWVVRRPGAKPGTGALEAVQSLDFPPGALHAYVVGESALPTSLRRWLVAERGVPKSNVTFCGYWRVGVSH